MSNESTFALIEAERLRLARIVETLTPEQLDEPSLANGWRIRDVVAHTTMAFSVRMPELVLGLVRHRGSFDRFADRWARDTAAATSPAELVAALRAGAGARFTPPGLGPEAPLTDVVVHALDIVVPLGLPTDDFDPEALAVVLAFLTTRVASRFGVTGHPFASDRFEATDLDWAHGTGPTQRGTATDLIVHFCRSRPLPPS